MTFITEPTGYEKTAISDLQGSWENLRNTVIELFGFPDAEKLLFHINEAMSWESVRDLDRMKVTLVIVRNIAIKGPAPDEVLEWVGDVGETLDDVFEAIIEGKAK